ncbi:MAG: hypothetical protein JKY37_00010 [Nannocystaceae bacterium]|nr:hypothetical protein [Nannocystaceae bacterium]
MNYCSLVMKISLISLAGMLAAGCSSDSDPADTGNDDAETGADDGGNGNGDGDGNDDGADDGNDDGADDGNDDGADDGNDDGADDGNDDGGNPIAGECDLGQRVGRFDVILEETYSAIDGEIREALVQTAVLTEAANEGGCRLIRSEFPFCDPPCGGGDACTEGGCVPFPARMEVGVVTITGLEAEAVMEPAADSRYFKTDLPHPAIVAGASIELHAEGGGGFTMQGAGFGAL